MIKSMTGYGQSQLSREGVTLTTDIHCLNSRFFDLTARLPRALQKWEPQVRQEAQGVLRRGKVSVNVTVGLDEDAGPPVYVNRSRLQLYQDLFKQIQDELGLPEGASLAHYTAIDDVFIVEEPEHDSLFQELLFESVGEALSGLNAMREAEGANLAADLQVRISQIIEEIMSIEQLAEDRRSGDFERYRSRIQELVEGIPLDESRLLQEAAILADKRDITEECTRIKSHLDLFRAYTEGEKDSGKRLGFLLQEMGREVNTLGAKTDHIDISHTVVRIKDQLEKIREQVQNIL
ncbi:MAG: YicC family protein [Fidelibacterota bacterium]|nr:MAG: YicC family protein [Candidatus Neomarinimicrobiota bacterium]